MQAEQQMLLIENDQLDAELAQITLQRAGFAVLTTYSVVEGERLARQVLTPQAVRIPTAILLDLKMPDPSHPYLESSLLAAALRGAMLDGTLQPAWLIAYTNDLTSAREDEAHFAGCQHVLRKPLTDHMAAWLATLVHDSVPLPNQLDNGAKFYRAKAEEILSLIHRSQPCQRYTARDIHLLLHATTLYPAPTPRDDARQAGLLAGLGGAGSVRHLLATWADTREARDPHATILRALLNGHQPADLYRYEHLAYNHRSTVFRYIQQLPDTIARSFSTSLV